jgi:hypothetical protein
MNTHLNNEGKELKTCPVRGRVMLGGRMEKVKKDKVLWRGSSGRLPT